MKQIGIDFGSSTIKLVITENGSIEECIIRTHHGRIIETLIEVMKDLDLPEEIKLSITGANRRRLIEISPDLEQMEDIPAIVEGLRAIAPEAGSLIEIGSQSARFISGLQDRTPSFSVNEHCAGGTGSFFEDQMTRLGLVMEDYSSLVEKAKSIPSLSGRCAVFAKTDIIHRQQEGVSKEDILLGLCYAMIRNYKATIVRNLPVTKPLAFCGGVTENSGVVRAINDIFKLTDGELIVPEKARFVAAIGASLNADNTITISHFMEILKSAGTHSSTGISLPPLELDEGLELKDPPCSEVIPEEGAYLGIDVGSTSTDLVLVSKDGKLIDFQYLRTKGDPEGVVRHGMAEIEKKYGTFPILGVGITGSGRERLGRMMASDAIRDEITSQAKAATFWVPDADTVFEIGGQDSKFISIRDGEVVDFQMNRICAAGTGSFVEEQAMRMNIPISEFGPLALRSEHPSDLGERCTVFIETSISQKEAEGATREDIAAGLCHSIVRNYLHKVVGGKKVGLHIVLQGGVAYNPGIVAAFRYECGDKMTVSPVFSISGAFGVALLAKEAVGNGKSTFLGFDFPDKDINRETRSEDIRRNREFYRKAGQLAVEDYDGKIDPGKKTVGVPLSLVMFKFFPLANAFFKSLGFNVILSSPTNEETIRLSQSYAQGETCYPIKLLFGHMAELAEKKVDYIFLPRIHTIRHPHSHAVHNYACPYMQTAAMTVFETLGLDKKGIKLLSPILDLDLGAKMMGVAMLETGKSLGFPKPRCIPGLMKGALAVKKYSAGVEKLGRDMLSTLKPEDKVLVLITRNYGISDPVLNMGIPELLLSRGYKVLTLGHLPGMDLDISGDYPDMYWPFGDHLLSGAKLIAHHPNLYAVYLTNHGCGPDTLISHMFKEEMGSKPYLQIEVDEHFSKVGVITRVEAFLNSLSHREPAVMPENFNILDVSMHGANITDTPSKDSTLMIPDLGLYTPYIRAYYESLGHNVSSMPAFDRESLVLGRAEMNSKEYLPLPMILGSALRAIRENGGDGNLEFLVPFSYGADADGQYPRALRTILDRLGYRDCRIVSPILEETPDKAENFPLLFRAILTGDVLYSLTPEKRLDLMPTGIPTMEELIALVRNVEVPDERFIGVIGSPLCMTSLDEGILPALESEGWTVGRVPLSEMLAFLWKDNGRIVDMKAMEEVSHALGKRSLFSGNLDELFSIADKRLPGFAGNNGRYRYSKSIELGEKVSAILSASPRYENTQMVLSMSGVGDNAKVPIFDMNLDGDWDENSWSRLRSFLYYCK